MNALWLSGGQFGASFSKRQLLRLRDRNFLFLNLKLRESRVTSIGL